MEILEGIVLRFWSAGPWLLLGCVVLSALERVYRQLRWQRQMAGLARSFGLQPLDVGSSLWGFLLDKPGLNGTLHGQAVRLTVEPQRQGSNLRTSRSTTRLRLRVEPFLSADLRAGSERSQLLLAAIPWMDRRAGGAEVDQLLRITEEGTLDHAVLRMTRVREVLADLLDACDEWNFVRGDLQLRKHSSFFGTLKDARALLELSADLAEVLTSQEVAEVLRGGPKPTSVWVA